MKLKKKKEEYSLFSLSSYLTANTCHLKTTKHHFFANWSIPMTILLVWLPRTLHFWSITGKSHLGFLNSWKKKWVSEKKIVKMVEEGIWGSHFYILEVGIEWVQHKLLACWVLLKLFVIAQFQFLLVLWLLL